jgi:hypothetical protein
MALTTILEPGKLDPIVAYSFDTKDIYKIDRTLSRAKCHALGINEHPPRVVLHGPMHLGGTSIHTALSKTMTIHINYFLFHMCTDTKISKKFSASIAFLQIESGLFCQLFHAPFKIYGHLLTRTLVKCLWTETEP